MLFVAISSRACVLSERFLSVGHSLLPPFPLQVFLFLFQELTPPLGDEFVNGGDAGWNVPVPLNGASLKLRRGEHSRSLPRYSRQNLPHLRLHAAAVPGRPDP